MPTGKLQADPWHQFETAQSPAATGLGLLQKRYACVKVPKGDQRGSALIGVRIEFQGRRGNDSQRSF